jgi:hypothetical protein
VIYSGGTIFEAGRRHPDGSYVHHYRKLKILVPLPLPRVVLTGPRCWTLCRDSQPDPDCWQQNVYDFADDVRELVCERIRFDVYAMWSDPREQWPAR